MIVIPIICFSLSFYLLASCIAVPALPLTSTSGFALPGVPSRGNHNPLGFGNNQTLPSTSLPVDRIVWKRKVACFPGPDFVVPDQQCLRAINKILLQHDSAVNQTFGIEGKYTGPRFWTYGACKITLDLINTKIWINTLLFVAKMASDVTASCNLPTSQFQGGVYFRIDPSRAMNFVRVIVGRSDVSSDTNITTTPASPVNATGLSKEDPRVTCNPGPGYYILEPDWHCMRVTNMMLLEMYSAIIFQFGRDSNYYGPREWKYLTCKVSLVQNPELAYLGTINGFAAAAALVTDICYKADQPYFGGTWNSNLPDEGKPSVQVVVARN